MALNVIMSDELVINHIFAKTAQRFTEKICLQIEKNGVWEKYTYTQVEELSRKVAAFLINEGIGKGDFVLLILNNCPQWAIFYLAITYAGACVVPVDPQAAVKEIENITADCNPKAVFTSERIFSENNFAG